MRTLRFIGFVVVLFSIFVIGAKAAAIDTFDNSLEELKNGFSDELREDLETLGMDSYDLSTLADADAASLYQLLSEKFSENITGPLSAGGVVIAVILLSSLLEGYTDTLRYSSTKEVMHIVSSLCIGIAILTPLLQLVRDSVSVVGMTSSLMLVYIPIIIGILLFSGRGAGFVGQYGLMMSICQIVGQVMSSVFAPMICLYFGLSFSSGVGDRIRLKGICELIAKVLKWGIAFLMSIFSAALTVRSVITGALDTVATRAVRFTLSSFIPLVGTAISEAYRTINASLNVLRSGSGVFVIAAVMLSFLPVMVRCVLWMLSVHVCKAISELLGVLSSGEMLGALSSGLTILVAMLISVMTVFVISTAVLVMLGGSA